MIDRVTVMLGCLVSVLVSGLHAEPVPWHAPGYAHRAVVRVTGGGSKGVDVAALRLRHAGTLRADANDLRPFDAAGEPVPYQVTYHDPLRDTLISFRAPQPTGRYYLYFTNPDATVDPMRAIVDDAPGSGPPRPGPAAAGWIPRAGLVLTTMRRPRDVPNPESIDEFTALLDQSPGLDGAAYRRNISDGLNPFGDSDYYLSVYRGWIRLPTAGNYGFCTASNEASFSFIDGRELVHWPGRHTEQRGKLGQKDAQHTLDAGLHYVEYLHEEVLLYQIAFLGYRPPGTPHYVGIPDALFPQPHRAEVEHVEQQDGSLTVLPRITLLDSVWPRHRETGQYTRYRFVADAGTGAEDALDRWRIRWQFGDGIEAEGAAVEHVYLATGDYAVTLHVTTSDGRTIERRWPVTVYPIEHLDGPYEAGNRETYVAIVNGYDRGGLATASLVELAYLYADVEAAAAARASAELVLARRDLPAEVKPAMHRLAAGEAGDLLRAWLMPPDPTARRHLASAAETTEEPADRLRALARLIRQVGVSGGDTDAAAAHYAEAETIVRENVLAGEVKQAFRAATLAMGDAHLAAEQLDAAAEDYRTAEALAEPVVPAPVRAARTGGYPEALAQHVDADRIDAAWATLREWVEMFPSEQLRGQTLYWLGKLALIEGDGVGAVRPLRLAIALAPGAPFEAEARWLLAEAHGRAGDAAARRAALEALVRTGLVSPYREQAKTALREMQE